VVPSFAKTSLTRLLANARRDGNLERVPLVELMHEHGGSESGVVLFLSPLLSLGVCSSSGPCCDPCWVPYLLLWLPLALLLLVFATATATLIVTIPCTGINVRLLGHVLQYTTDRDLCLFLLTEAISRVLKNELNRNLRIKTSQTKVLMMAPYRQMVIDFLNRVFGDDSYLRSAFYWQNTVGARLQRDFYVDEDTLTGVLRATVTTPARTPRGTSTEENPLSLPSYVPQIRGLLALKVGFVFTHLSLRVHLGVWFWIHRGCRFVCFSRCFSV
jgi:hypothetical protein